MSFRPVSAHGSSVVTSTTSRMVPKGDVAFVISGGVSLGVYQAGFLYLITEAMKRGRRFRIPLVTGASAGSANALITALNSCLPPNDTPSDDLGWKTWMPVGYRELFAEDEVTPLSAFSRAPLERALDMIYEHFKRGLPESCDVVLGVTTTRVNAHSVTIHPGFDVPRQEEKFRFRIQGRGANRVPELTNYVNPHAHVQQVIVPFEKEGERPDAARLNFERFRDVIFASGAFPAAFDPQGVLHCFTKPYSDQVSCADLPRVDKFVDGGVFDNNPLRLAGQIAKDGLRQGDTAGQWRNLSEQNDPQPTHRELSFVYLDPTTTAYPGFESTDSAPSHSTLLSFAQSLTGEWVTSARAKELYEATQERRDLGERMRLTESHYPMASNHIYAFLGFFERAFRHFDYHLGMYDAFVALGRPSRGLPIDTGPNASADDVPAPWRPFACLLGAFEDGQESLREACHAQEMTAFRILVQVSLDRMHDHCRRIPLARLGRGRSHVRCSEAARGFDNVRILPVPKGAKLTKSRDEDRFDYFMRLLAIYGFHFEDLGLKVDESEYGKIQVRRKLLKMVKRLAGAQGSVEERLLLLTVGRNLVNSIAYEPPREWYYTQIGTVVEAGTSFLPFDWLESWARAHASLQLKGLSTLLTPDRNKFGLVLTLGAELEPIFITTSFIQPMIGLRAGYQFSSRDTFGFRRCTQNRAFGDQRLCSQFLLQGYLAVAFLERIRVQVTGELFPIGRNFDDRIFDLQIGFGVHFF